MPLHAYIHAHVPDRFDEARACDGVQISYACVNSANCYSTDHLQLNTHTQVLARRWRVTCKKTFSNSRVFVVLCASSFTHTCTTQAHTHAVFLLAWSEVSYLCTIVLALGRPHAGSYLLLAEGLLHVLDPCLVEVAIA